ncbi:MAG: HTH-type transcriptional regulator BhcR [Pseudomonadota bacterium]
MNDVPEREPGSHTGRHRSRGRPRIESARAAPVKALDRGLHLLRAMTSASGSSLTNLALHVGMPPATAHRILTTFESHGFVQFDAETQKWSIGLEAYRVGSQYLNDTSLIQAASGVLHNLMEQTGETANLAIADQGDVVFLTQAECHSPIRAFHPPGTRGHMHSSGIGKALLASLPQREVEKILQQRGCPSFTDKTLSNPSALFDELSAIRARGWSLDDEERHAGMRCIAACVKNVFGESIAGISVSGPTARLTDDDITRIAPIVVASANELTRLIGGADTNS